MAEFVDRQPHNFIALRMFSFFFACRCFEYKWNNYIDKT